MAPHLYPCAQPDSEWLEDEELDDLDALATVDRIHGHADNDD
jgi:hypothetical protein